MPRIRADRRGATASFPRLAGTGFPGGHRRARRPPHAPDPGPTPLIQISFFPIPFPVLLIDRSF
ncbi:hypothetical protein AZ22_3219 [Bordetella bronchiseptica 980-2]|nr:hypothetical protein AZ22_3219 [Bordetella bronchiseptica 980-2]KCV53298.1 hypothetical protein L491_3211 [Bordetella bronchiseptica 3E44]KCV59077.1 hypothetical protein AZ14_3286 [Bordetella bronchiseptica 980]KDB60716.1 hypothetical protein AZ15_3345 [Bordetella bronchiseptica A1-7]KDB71772.1 hypothetical protein AZ21_3284 [Bordetella bronchiseptica B20-10725633]KDB78606.1 hypothetical protein L495_3212 [Bordetella bronchiseptica CARE970018BB]KDB82050.1 hypothetical protein AZ27_3171 [Bo